MHRLLIIAVFTNIIHNITETQFLLHLKQPFPLLQAKSQVYETNLCIRDELQPLPMLVRALSIFQLQTPASISVFIMVKNVLLISGPPLPF